MEINIDSKAIEQHVSDAIIKSAIGERIEKAVRELLNKGYDNPIDKAIVVAIQEAALSMVRTHYAAVIEEAVKAKMTQETVDAMVAKFWDKMLRQ